VPPAESFRGGSDFDLSRYLIEGAERFFARTDRTTLLTWRMLMLSQYRYPSARATVEEQLLDTPVRFFTELLANLQRAGHLRREVDCERAGRMIAARFFDFSFRSNLKAAWDEESDTEFSRLKEDLESLAAWMEAGPK
jgi:hypothetical protein